MQTRSMEILNSASDPQRKSRLDELKLAMLFFLLLMLLLRSVCHQVSNQADQSDLLAIILLLADVSPTYSSGLPQGNVF